MLLSLVGLFGEGCHGFHFVLLLLSSSCLICMFRGGGGVCVGGFWGLLGLVAVFLGRFGCIV